MFQNAPREGGGIIGQRRDPLPHALSRRAERLEDLEELVDLGATSEQHGQVTAMKMTMTQSRRKVGTNHMHARERAATGEASSTKIRALPQLGREK